jgi:hypothetical protein
LKNAINLSLDYLPPGLELADLPPQRLPSEAVSPGLSQRPEALPLQDTTKNARLIIKAILLLLLNIEKIEVIIWSFRTSDW